MIMLLQAAIEQVQTVPSQEDAIARILIGLGVNGPLTGIVLWSLSKLWAEIKEQIGGLTLAVNENTREQRTMRDTFIEQGARFNPPRGNA